MDGPPDHAHISRMQRFPKPRSGAWLPVAVAAGIALLSSSLPAVAQETIEQFDKSNAEKRLYTDQQNQIRNQRLRLEQDRARDLLGCSGIGSAQAAKACAGNVEIGNRQQRYRLDNQAIQQRNEHQGILRGLGVNPVQ